MKLEMRKLTDLKAASYNPRVPLRPGDKEYEKIKSSIEHFGFVQPVVINFDNTIISGHQRVTIMSNLGYDEVECVIVDLSKEEEKLLNITMNKLDGKWDESLLTELLANLDDNALSLTGFDEVEMEHLLNSQLATFEMDKVGDLNEYVQPSRKSYRCPACGHVAPVEEFKEVTP